MSASNSTDEDDDEFFAELLTTLDNDLGDALGQAESDGDAASSQAPVGDLSGAFSSPPTDNGGAFAAFVGDYVLPLGMDDAAAGPDSSPSDVPTNSPCFSLDRDASADPTLLDIASNTTGHKAKEDDTLAVVTPATLSTSGVRDGSNSFKRRKDPNKARNERAREIRGLKSEVVELTAQLKTLKTLTVRDANGRPSCATNNTLRAPLSAGLMGTPPVWEAICRNQLARRARSERENVRLKRALEEQVRLANSLERVLKKPSRAMVRRCVSLVVYGTSCCEVTVCVLTITLLHVTQRSTGDIDLCASKRVYSLPSDSDADAKIFNLLLAEADAAYYEINGILELNGIAGSQTEPIRGAQMRDGDHGRFLDMFSSNVLPFSLDATAEVVWRFHSGTGKHRGPLYYKTTKVSMLILSLRWRLSCLH